MGGVDVLGFSCVEQQMEVNVMLNVIKVRGRMAELRITQKDVATALNIAQSTASQKLNRVRPLDLDEAEKLACLLKLEDSQFAEYFFA